MNRSPHRTNRGVTLIEMLIVVLIISLVAGVSYPSLVSGLEGLRISEASAQVAALLTSALNRVERRQQPIEVTVDLQQGTLRLTSVDPGFQRELILSGVTIRDVHPRIAGTDPSQPRRFLLLPGALPPRVAIELANQHGARRIVRIDPITAVAQIEVPKEGE